MNIDRDIEHLKGYRDIPEGSIIAYNYTKKCVDLIESARKVQKKSSEGPVEAWEFTSMTNWISGENGVILSRLIQGMWKDRVDNIGFIKNYLDKVNQGNKKGKVA
jgi:hypothetical protein